VGCPNFFEGFAARKGWRRIAEERDYGACALLGNWGPRLEAEPPLGGARAAPSQLPRGAGGPREGMEAVAARGRPTMRTAGCGE
jgi:hypothetical protein